MKDRDKLIQAVKKAVHEISPDAKIILFGSRSRGDYTKESDWDFLILTEDNTEVKESKIRSRLYEVELKTDQVISSIFYSKKEWEKRAVMPLYKNVASDGIAV